MCRNDCLHGSGGTKLGFSQEDVGKKFRELPEEERRIQEEEGMLFTMLK